MLLDDEQYQRTQQLVRDFSEGEGTQCQAELDGFAEAECAEGRNWMSEMWLEAYLAGRTPVTLTSNVGFSLALTHDESLGDPIERAADLLVRCAATHLEHLRSETSEQLTPRGAPLCMQQWRYLAGGARHPPADIDGFLPGPTDAANAACWCCGGQAIGATVEFPLGGHERLLSVAAATGHLQRGPDGVAVDLDHPDVFVLGERDDEDRRMRTVITPKMPAVPSGRTTGPRGRSSSCSRTWSRCW